MTGYIDQQIRHNDCGISVIKTIFNLQKISIDRSFIEQNVFTDEKGSTLSSIKSFFDANNFSANYKFIDLNYVDKEDSN